MNETTIMCNQEAMFSKLIASTLRVQFILKKCQIYFLVLTCCVVSVKAKRGLSAKK